MIEPHLPLPVLAPLDARLLALPPPLAPPFCLRGVRLRVRLHVDLAFLLGSSSAPLHLRGQPLQSTSVTILLVLLLLFLGTTSATTASRRRRRRRRSSNGGTFFGAGLGGQVAEALFLGLLFFEGVGLADLRAGLDFLAGRALRNVQSFRQRREVVVDGLFLQAAAVRCQALVQSDRVPARVLPVRHARRDLPGLLVRDGHLPRRRVQDGNGRRRRSARDFGVFVLRRLHRVHLLVHHLDDALARSVPGRVRVGRVPHVRRLVLFAGLGHVRRAGRVNFRL
mmetsp:Transcript_22088/g.67971  ORF Transcript_22088/g.67971 Transcript_22088/m.67971 type:complete len:281 (-) Transcript_22088:430-1272(-)